MGIGWQLRYITEINFSGEKFMKRSGAALKTYYFNKFAMQYATRNKRLTT